MMNVESDFTVRTLLKKFRELQNAKKHDGKTSYPSSFQPLFSIFF
jgi:hypothetical protein